jgi:predicted phage terminase large subunit-like protein
MPSADQVPVDCAHSTMQRRKWVVLIAGSTGSALRAVRPFQPSHHAEKSARPSSRRKCDGFFVTLALGHHGPRHPRDLVGERIPLGYGRVHHRKVDDVLDPIREPLSALNKLRADMTPLQFSAQYQQRPIPLEGNIIKREWLHYLKGPIPRAPGDYFVISWDTAMKSSVLCDYSVGTVWHVQGRGKKKNLVDVVRGRFEYPELITRAVALWKKWKFEGHTTHLVIEDKGSGSSLIQSLKNERIYVSYYKPKLDGDKVMRLTAHAAEFHAGTIHLPEDAPWVGDLVFELLGFPGVRHDDQVDSISQALACMQWVESHRCGRVELRI